MEVTPGFEPGNESFADSCLTTWLCHHGVYLYDMRTLQESQHLFLVEEAHISVSLFLERATRLELATSTLARWRSTR